MIIVIILGEDMLKYAFGFNHYKKTSTETNSLYSEAATESYKVTYLL